MRLLLCCLSLLFVLPACTAFAFNDDHVIVSTTYENKASMAMLYDALEAGTAGHQMTPIYKPVVYDAAYQQAHLPASYRTTLQSIVDYIRF